MIDKKAARLRRSAQTRLKVHKLRAVRLAVHRTNGHIYAQIFSAEGDKVLASASTAEKDVRAKLASGGNKAAPSLSKPEVEDTLLRVLEWMPSNLVIGREARALDPGDWLDVEALGRHPDRATRQLLAKIGEGGCGIVYAAEQLAAIDARLG